MIISGEKLKPEKRSSVSTEKPKKGRPIMKFCKTIERFVAPPVPTVVVLTDDDDDE